MDWRSNYTERKTREPRQEYGAHCAPFLAFYKSLQEMSGDKVLRPVTVDYSSASARPTLREIMDERRYGKTAEPNGHLMKTYQEEPSQYHYQPVRQEAYKSSNNHCCHCQIPPHVEQIVSSRTHSMSRFPEGAFQYSTRHNQVAHDQSYSSQTPTYNHISVTRTVDEFDDRTSRRNQPRNSNQHSLSPAFKSKLDKHIEMDIDGPSPRGKSPVPTSKNSMGQPSQNKPSDSSTIAELSRLLVEKAEEAEAASLQFKTLEDLVKRLHASLKDEKERNQVLEDELIRLSRHQEKLEPTPGLEAIEKKYRELKLMIDQTNAAQENMKVFENGLHDCFDLFTGIFEAIVMNRNQKSVGYEAIQNKIMVFFEAHNILIGKFGYQEKLISILKAYKSQQSTENKKKQLDFSPVRLEQRLDENKENSYLNCMNRTPNSKKVSRKLQPFQNERVSTDRESDLDDTITNYDFRLH